LGEHKSAHIPKSFEDKNTGEVNKALMHAHANAQGWPTHLWRVRIPDFSSFCRFTLVISVFFWVGCFDFINFFLFYKSIS
jgi:hypothetical protein